MAAAAATGRFRTSISTRRVRSPLAASTPRTSRSFAPPGAPVSERPGESGAFTATPVVVGGVVYLQDMDSNVFALDLTSGKMRWRHLFKASNPGPDGLAVSGRRVYGATDTSAFALNAATGRLLWRTTLVTDGARYVDIAPQVADRVVFAATLGYPPDGRGAPLRPRCEDRAGSLEVRDDQGTLERAVRGGRRRRLGDTECRRPGCVSWDSRTPIPTAALARTPMAAPIQAQRSIPTLS